jgi:hypothetical protein
MSNVRSSDDGMVSIDMSNYYGFNVKITEKKKVDIGIAFFTSATPPNMIVNDDNRLMQMISYLQNKYHNSEESYIHCALVLIHPVDGDEYVYHFNRRGVLREEGKDFKGKWAWQKFKTLTMEWDDFKACVDWMDSILHKKLETMEPNYDAIPLPSIVYRYTGYDLFPMAFLYICCEINILKPFRWLVKWCCGDRDEKFNCSSFICRALQMANLPEVKDFKHKITTTHEIFMGVKDRPDAGPSTISSLKPKGYEHFWSGE